MSIKRNSHPVSTEIIFLNKLKLLVQSSLHFSQMWLSVCHILISINTEFTGINHNIIPEGKTAYIKNHTNLFSFNDPVSFAIFYFLRLLFPPYCNYACQKQTQETKIAVEETALLPRT